MKTSFSLVILSNESLYPRESNILNTYAEEIHSFHFRKYGMQDEEALNWLETLHENARRKTVLHSHNHLADKIRCKGVHHKGNNQDRQLTSIGIHSLSEMRVDLKPEYYLYSPVFPSISKRNYRPAKKLEEVSREISALKVHNDFKIIALGGVDDHTIEACMESAFDGACVYGYLWNNPERAEKNLESLLKKLS